MTLAVETCRYGVRDPWWIDITRAGCDRAAKEGRPAPGEFLAPSAALVYEAVDRRRRLVAARPRMDPVEWARRDLEEWGEYEAAYVQEMRASYRRRRAEWAVFLGGFDRVCLACFCEDRARCHRSIAARLLEKCGAADLGEVPTRRAISVRQPWAWAILRAGKRIENRGLTWRNTAPGPALLHAAKGCSRAEYEGAAEMIEAITGAPPPPLDELYRGGLVGELVVADVIGGSSPALKDPRALNPWFMGPLGLLLDEVQERPPVALAGALGWFEVSERYLRNWSGDASTGTHELLQEPAQSCAPGISGSQGQNAAVWNAAALGRDAAAAGAGGESRAEGPEIEHAR